MKTLNQLIIGNTPLIAQKAREINNVVGLTEWFQAEFLNELPQDCFTPQIYEAMRSFMQDQRTFFP